MHAPACNLEQQRCNAAVEKVDARQAARCDTLERQAL